ncbi:MAG: DNA-directed RNA polymerase subunit beta [Clostridiales bacterium]|nr:DNA-directed RNA polymerase subunit beta [Clostridiales bacterium]
MVHPIKYGTNTRMSFSKIREVQDVPDLIEIQKKSFQWFLSEGLSEVLEDISPIVDYGNNMELDFYDYYFDEDIKYSIQECKERGVTYAAPLKVKVRLINHNTNEIVDPQKGIYMGDFPMMTPAGTFIINGAERVVVSQLARSPGVYYKDKRDKNGARLFDATVIPMRGVWIEYETDAKKVVYVRLDKTRKFPVTTFLRALGFSTDAQITELLGESEILSATLEKDTTKNQLEALEEIYKRLRPGDPPTEESAKQLIAGLFFDPRKYELARVGRYKFNDKLGIKNRIEGKKVRDDIFSPVTGELIAAAGEILTADQAAEIEDAGILSVYIVLDSGAELKVVGNGFVDASKYLDFDPEEAKLYEKVSYRKLKEVLDLNLEGEELKKVIAERAKEICPHNITIEDIVATVSYIINLDSNVGGIDDIDHLGNRRVRAVGELLQNQFRVGMTRIDRVVRERMSTLDTETVTPNDLINIRPLVAAMNEFFGSSQLSQFMDQPNPLAELTHKRRLSALGPGGLSRDRASSDVRDVHDSHYSRMCPIETPEGPNIGLIGSLATYARINKYGFIEAPYKRVDKENKTVTNDIVYLTAEKEEGLVIAQSNEPLDENNFFVNERVMCRVSFEIKEMPRERVDLMDISPKQIVSVATAMIPFLENDDATRALMGSNMQRQAVPLIQTDSPIVGTGMEYRAAKDSGTVVRAPAAGTIVKVDSDAIVILDEENKKHTVPLLKFKRSNQGTCINHKPFVNVGDKVEEGDVIADGPSSDHGEVALGRNALVGYMMWEGYNYEDAILISERLVKDDVYTSIHIEQYEIEARDTKLGPEEITREIPNVSDDVIKDLDERGIVRIGAVVMSGDVLVGKVTPKGETEQTAEERLLRAIFGEKAREVRDTSLKVPHGEGGVVVDVKLFTRENKDELKPGTNQLVRVSIAQKRKISVGDKVAGRHGNKGVISRILPVADMPFLEDGTPLDIVLNPLGVPSRMNIGQVLETHLGWAAKALGWKIATPVFDGARQTEVEDTLEQAGFPRDGKMQLFDGRTGEPFDNKVTVGYNYIMKLNHLVDDKIHARSIGPYSLVTQQPLGGKAQFGGQRFGEMEVWALEAYGAAHTLQEILTIKSDDCDGRQKAYEAIFKGKNLPRPGVPESFKVLIKELQSLGVDMKITTAQGENVSIRNVIEDQATDTDAFFETDYLSIIGKSSDGANGDDADSVIDDFDIDSVLDIGLFDGGDGYDEEASFEQEDEDRDPFEGLEPDNIDIDEDI